MIELAFDMKAVQKNDGGIDYSIFQEKNRLPKNSVVRVYDTTTGSGPHLFYVSGVNQPTPNSTSFTHTLTPLPRAEYVGHG